jgi:hypothetical protein
MTVDRSNAYNLAFIISGSFVEFEIRVLTLKGRKLPDIDETLAEVNTLLSDIHNLGSSSWENEELPQ